MVKEITTTTAIFIFMSFSTIMVNKFKYDKQGKVIRPNFRHIPIEYL